MVTSELVVVLVQARAVTCTAVGPLGGAFKTKLKTGSASGLEEKY